MDLTSLAVAGMSLVGTLAGTFGGILVSNRLIGRVKAARILSNVFGSDHCPVLIELE